MKDYELFEKQYGEKKLIYSPPRQYWGIRALLKKYDLDSYKACAKLISTGHRCLDIGCGEGYLLRSLSGKFQELYGLDISPSILREAQQKTWERMPSESHKFNWIIGNVSEGIPFNDEVFDAIICVAVMQCVYDLFELMKEIGRVIKKEGEVIVQVPNMAYFFRRFDLALGKLPVTSAAMNWDEIGWDGGSIHYFTMKKLCWLFETNGFKIAVKSGSGFIAPLRNWYPSLLTADLIIKACKITKEK